MKRSSRPRREQPKLNIEAVPETEEQYSLEDIISEFGGWSKQPEPEQEPAADTEEENAFPSDQEAAVSQQTPETPEESTEPAEQEKEAPAAEAPKAPSKFKFIHLESVSMEQVLDAGETETQDGQPAAGAEKIWTYRKERAIQEELPQRTPQRQRGPRVPKQRSVRTQRPPKPDPVCPLPEEAYRTACKRSGSILLRYRLEGLFCLLAIAVTVCGHLNVQIGGITLDGKLISPILLGLLLAGALTAHDVLVDGVYHILQLRPRLDSLLFVQAVVFLIDGFRSIAGERSPYVAVLLLGLFFAMWGKALENRAARNSLKAVLSMDAHPASATVSQRAWGSHDCIFRAEGNRECFAAELISEDGASKAMGIYASVVLCLSLVLSLLICFLKGRDFLWSWSAMLAGAVPVTASIAYWRPFAALTARLLHSGAALCGWHGAKELSGNCCVAVEDSDLFSRANVSMNGMKVFGEYNVSQVVGYTYAVIAASGCGLEPTFHDVFVNQNGRSYVIDNFRRYEGGGIGAEIQGEVILVGSIGFMQLMGVQMPEGTNVRQAVYCAVNNRLAAVFAIHYNPSAAVKSGLHMILRSKGLTLLLATRDFVLTPAMVRHKFKVPSDFIEYPSVEERVRLSGPYAAAGGRQAALMARDSFLSMAEAVTGGRGLCRSVYACLGVNLLGGLLGFCITIVLAYLGAFAAASAFNLMLFALLWSMPALLLASNMGK